MSVKKCKILHTEDVIATAAKQIRTELSRSRRILRKEMKLLQSVGTDISKRFCSNKRLCFAYVSDVSRFDFLIARSKM